MKWLLIIAAAFVAFVGSVVIYITLVNNDLVRQENGIIAVHEDMKNVNASALNTMKSQGMVVEKYGDMVISAIRVAVEGRYGKNGAQAGMLWIKEQNPTIDAKTLEKLQVAIEAGYSKFESAQRTKIDRIRTYDNILGSWPRGLVAKMIGFPRKITADMRETISSADTKETFRTKEQKAIDPFGKS